MVIDRIAKGRSHRVVGTERREALACCQRNPVDGTMPAVVGGEEQLVGVGVRVAAVDETLAPGARQ